MKYAKVCLAISFSKNSCHVETVQLICIETQLTGLYMASILQKVFLEKTLIINT